ncbi:uncharacterized protein TNCV_4317241 [Trichonephila clavipes]|nr:uncharacterized protein TNCV_4317241 [Trichonephila clavipes]
MLREPVRQVVLIYDRCRHHLSPPPQFRHGTGGEGNILQSSAPMVSAASAYKTFGPPDLMSTRAPTLGAKPEKAPRENEIAPSKPDNGDK